jgi:hypothetical protein
MKTTTITIWVHPNDEIQFLQYLDIIDKLPIESSYTWETKDVKISKAMISNWIWVNIPIETYVKFMASWRFNGGTFS